MTDNNLKQSDYMLLSSFVIVDHALQDSESNAGMWDEIKFCTLKNFLVVISSTYNRNNLLHRRILNICTNICSRLTESYELHISFDTTHQIVPRISGISTKTDLLTKIAQCIYFDFTLMRSTLARIYGTRVFICTSAFPGRIFPHMNTPSGSFCI